MGEVVGEMAEEVPMAVETVEIRPVMKTSAHMWSLSVAATAVAIEVGLRDHDIKVGISV